MKCVAVCCLFAIASLASAQDPIGDKLKAAKTTFETDMGKYRKAVETWFDTRNENARNNLDKKLVAQIKTERDAFNEFGDLPKNAENLIALGADAQKPLEDAFKEGAAAYFKAKMDKEAAAVEKELPELLLKNKRANWVADLKFIKAKELKGFAGIGKHAVSVKEVPFEQAVIMHPGRGAPSEATYALGKGYESFRSKFVVNRPSVVDAKGPPSPATFEVLSNGKSIWKSKPVAVFDEIQECSVKLKGLETVTLRVSCSGDHVHCHAYWLDPILTR